MNDGILPSKNNDIGSIIDNFNEIISQLSTPSPNDDKYEDSINSDICFIYKEAISILNDISSNIETNSSDRTTPISFANYAKLQIEQMSTELERRIRLFDKSLTVACRVFNEKKEEIQTNFNTQFDQLKQKNRIEEKNLNWKLQQLQQSFETRLHSEISTYQKERNLIESQFTKLKSEFNLTQTTITSSLTASQMRSQLLEKQRDILQKTHSQVTSTISNKYYQQLKALQIQYKSQIKSIEIENSRLSTELKIASENYSSEKERLNYELENSDELHQNRIKSLIDKETVLFEKKKRKIESKHDKKMDELKHQLDLEEMKSKSEINLLNSEIKMHQQSIRDSEKQYIENLNDIDRKKKVRITAIESEIELLKKIQLNTLKQLSQQYQLDLEEESHKSAKIRENIDLIMTQNKRKADQERKKLETQITNLMRSKEKYEEELKKIKMRKNEMITFDRNQQKKLSIFDVFNVDPIELSNDMEVEKIIHENLDKVVDISKLENQSIQNANNALKNYYEIENQICLLKIEEIHQNINALNNEKEEILNDIKKIQTDITNSNSFVIKHHENRLIELRKIFETQESIIGNLRNDIQSKNEMKKIEISVIEEENEAELKKIKNSLEKLETNLNLKLNEIELEYENKISNEQTKTQEIIDVYRKRLIEIQDDIQNKKNEFENEIKKNFQNWSDTKKAVIQSTHKICQKFQSNTQSRPKTSSSLSLSSLPPIHSHLPLLKS